MSAPGHPAPADPVSARHAHEPVVSSDRASALARGARDAPARDARVARVDPADALFRGMPIADGIPRRFVVPAPTAEAARLTEGLLLAKWWAVHRIGRARYAHGPNGARWIYAFRLPGSENPVWLGRLESRADTRDRAVSTPGAESLVPLTPDLGALFPWGATIGGDPSADIRRVPATSGSIRP